jgi:hypothetical protein
MRLPTTTITAAERRRRHREMATATSAATSTTAVSTPATSARFELRHQPNVLWLTYEEMHRDLAAVVSKVSDHLGQNLSEKQVRRPAVLLVDQATWQCFTLALPQRT